ncbi:MAG: hypothetical protein Q9M20_03230 [Mariprofundaceae bacterium]|nr:hypothetical protein [Mariprofundaceae bacterium]
MRWAIAVMLIMLIAVPHSWPRSLFHIALFLSLTLVLQGDRKKAWQHWVRSWRILRWLLIPIIVLHGLFTPGEIIWVNFTVPISYEGLSLGLHLSLQLSEMFVGALLLGYLLPMKVWLEVMTLNPIIKRYLSPYVSPYIRLMPIMIRGVRVLVRRTYFSWYKETNKLSLFPLYIKTLLDDVSKYSHRRALYVWNSWDSPKFMVSEKEILLDQRRIIDTFYLSFTYIAAEFSIRYLWSW